MVTRLLNKPLSLATLRTPSFSLYTCRCAILSCSPTTPIFLVPNCPAAPLVSPRLCHTHMWFPLLQRPSPSSACLNSVQFARLRQVLHRMLVKNISFENNRALSLCFAPYCCVILTDWEILAVCCVALGKLPNHSVPQCCHL